MGIGAFAYPWSADLAARLQTTPADAMPLLFAHAVPPAIGLLGLAAIIGAVTSSFSSSILSAGSMLSWNCVKRLAWPSLSVAQLRRVIRVSILGFGAVATVLALKVQSVQALWFFTSDLVFVLLFPQLLYALFDPKANRTGSMAAFAVSFVLRVGGGEPLLGLPARGRHGSDPTAAGVAADRASGPAATAAQSGGWRVARPRGHAPA
jgi:solute carrier family 5 (high affinity choline transporter), member 7